MYPAESRKSPTIRKSPTTNSKPNVIDSRSKQVASGIPHEHSDGGVNWSWMPISLAIRRENVSYFASTLQRNNNTGIKHVRIMTVVVLPTIN